MFTCSVCNESLEEVKDFIRHLSLLHGDMPTFKCGELTCLRVFSSINSLRKHSSLKHGSNSSVYNMSIATNTASADEHHTAPSPSASPNIIEHFEENLHQFLETASSSSYSQQNNLVANDQQEFFSANELSYGINSHTLHNIFTAELLQYPDIPRNRAIDIINSTNSFIKTTLDNIKKELLTTIEIPTIHKSIETLFQKHTSIYEIPATEWNLLHRFQRLNTFIKPQEYLLGEITEFRKKK